MSKRAALSNLGTHVYGLAAIAIGVIGLWWGDFAAVWQPVPDGVPHRAGLAYVAACLFLLGGAAMQSRRTAPPGVLLLLVLYSMAAMLWLPRVIGFPRMIGTWSGFAEEFALVTAGVIAYASWAPPNTSWAVRTTQIARFLFGLCPIALGLAHFLAITETAAMVPKWIPPSQLFWARTTGVFHLLAGFAILSGIQAALASRLYTVMLLSFGALVWAPMLFAHPEAHIVWAGNAINLALAGAAWIIADSLAADSIGAHSTLAG